LKMVSKKYGPNKLTIEKMYSKRVDAIAAGQSHYFTGKPCKYDHISPRRTVNSGCLKCEYINYKKKYIPTPRKTLTVKEKAERKRVYRLANREKIKTQRQQHYQESKERLSRENREWRQANKEIINEKEREKYKKNPSTKQSLLPDKEEKKGTVVIMIKKNVSGGQTGADIAGIDAVIACNILYLEKIMDGPL
jgi:hypothetical protein